MNPSCCCFLRLQVEKVEAEQALSEAIPALEEAAAALNDLKRDDITEIRSFAKPHILVQKVGVAGQARRHLCALADRHKQTLINAQPSCQEQRRFLTATMGTLSNTTHLLHAAQPFS